MAKLADLMKGRKARKTVPFPGTIDNEGAAQAEIVLDLVILDGTQESTVLEHARAFAKGKGVDAPKEGEPQYDLGLMVHTLLTACVDHDSPRDAPAPFFASAEEILRHLDRERIAHLYAMQQVWQDSLSPASHQLSEEVIWGLVAQAAQEEDPLRFFEKLPPNTVARLLHFTAKQLVMLLRSRSASGSSSSPTGTSDTKNAEAPS